eukprot:8873476-Prorocentrum_lima.AAC.1
MHIPPHLHAPFPRRPLHAAGDSCCPPLMDTYTPSTLLLLYCLPILCARDVLRELVLIDAAGRGET